MIGIDIVDLNDPLFKKRTERSLDLITNEQDQFINHPDLFWLLWSAKEAVFKTRREITSFSPKNIPIVLKQEGSKIKFESDEIKGEIWTDKNYILSIAGDAIEPINFSVVNENSTNWSSTIRKRIKTHFANRGISASVSKSGSLPLINDRLPISITHHGAFAAFAYPNSVLES